MSTTGLPDVSIVIRTLDEAADVASVLEMVVAQRDVGRLEVIVIDSGSTDGTCEIVSRFPVRLHEVERRTFSFGGTLNLGARLARSPICVHLSAHCAPAGTDWLRMLLAPLEEAAVVATYGRQVPVPGVNPYEELETERAFPAGGAPDGRSYFSNANCAIRRQALLDRPFDETITGMEDALWAMDLEPGRRIVYIPEAAVRHSHPLRVSYWYRRYRRDGLAYRYLAAHRGADLLPARSVRAVARARGLMAEAAHVVRWLVARGYWRHVVAYPFFCALREIAVQQGLRDGAVRYAMAESTGLHAAVSKNSHTCGSSADALS